MKFKFKCKFCFTETYIDKKLKIYKDKKVIQRNKKHQKEWEEVQKEKEKAEKIFEKKKKRFLKFYYSFKKRYKNFDGRGLLGRIFGQPIYHKRFYFDHYMWTKHRKLWDKKFFFDRGFLNSQYFITLYFLKKEPEQYIICPVCKKNNYF